MNQRLEHIERQNIKLKVRIKALRRKLDTKMAVQRAFDSLALSIASRAFEGSAVWLDVDMAIFADEFKRRVGELVADMDLPEDLSGLLREKACSVRARYSCLATQDVKAV